MASVRHVTHHSKGGITLGHYDGAEFPMLRAVRKGLTAAKVDAPATPAKT
jgi:hypothetical protein